jgi:hypothetical protein
MISTTFTEFRLLFWPDLFGQPDVHVLANRLDGRNTTNLVARIWADRISEKMAEFLRLIPTTLTGYW